MRLTSLEKVFEESCEKHDHLKLLLSQWRFDKELISKALQNISSMFPHYSRHDSSHSKQIIVNIERMLGDRIYNLTATDMWLILESAYCHDIGMVVTHKQIQDMDTPEFKAFVSDIAVQPDHELHQFAVDWVGGGATLPEGAKAQVFFNEYRQLVAEWYRRKHPENSAKIVRDPLDEIGLSSPRNELLPRRLFGALGAICNAHGLPFDDVLQLPFSEAGMATEDCHPRYVAFLLRMADLLDVDDNRFCPVMMRMSGASLPASSHAHLEKHQGIKHFRLDSERIKIEVICPTPESYEIAHDWFKWLEREYHSQSQHWPKIVPNKKLGRLPTLSPPKVSLQKPYLILNEGKRPSFDLDQAAMLRILRGTGLYDSKLDSIREILQNAVDSTIIAIWQQHKDSIIEMDPGSEAILELYDKSKIYVDFGSSSSGDGKFSLTVKDFGTGISRSDLERMLRVGSSKKNTRRSRLIRDMPSWFRPSGNFGIGLQSISLLAEKFTVVTKSRESHESFKITFNLTSGSSVVVESIDGNDIDYGATVSVDIALDDFPETISIPWGKSRGLLMEKMNGYDFTEPGSDLKVYEQVRIFDAINTFNRGSPVKISSAQHSLPSDRKKIFFARDQNICLADVQFGYFDGSNGRTLFRGQPFSDLHPFLPLVSFEADFYGYEAIDFLTYSRGKILPHMRSRAGKQIKAAILRYIEEKFSFIDEQQRPCAAAFYYLHDRSSQFTAAMRRGLMSYTVEIDGEGAVPLSSVIDRIKSKQIVGFEVRQKRYHSIELVEDPKQTQASNIAILGGSVADVDINLIALLGTEQSLYWQELVPREGFSFKCSWSDKDIIPVCSDILKNIMCGEGSGFEIGKRMLFPAWGDYRKLAVNAELKWVRVHNHMAWHPEVIVLPYVFRHEGQAIAEKSRNLVDWVFVNRKNEEVTRQQISDLYDGLIADIDGICGCLPSDG
ncbi:ATP-binding protein [Stenotrophomonas sp. S41]|uniref:HD domain-containing protein n=1 Tax=Stenotrophomonas sp. S41 TaxID=2767464 RepID=UPI00190CC110|nr:ATP-binding protein [Stenotrophomonas sp. S41]MBK0011864.1 ATP-binding protein [Stenotrophomonas sp. S41]